MESEMKKKGYVIREKHSLIKKAATIVGAFLQLDFLMLLLDQFSYVSACVQFSALIYGEIRLMSLVTSLLSLS